MSGSSEKREPRDTTGLHVLVFVALASPFYLNDFANIFVKDWRLWLSIDYVGVKLLPIAIAAWLIGSKRMRPEQLGLRSQSLLSFLVVFLATALVGTLIDQNAYRLIAALPGYPALGSMPEIGSPAWNWFDLTVGLLMVGVVEELVFRGYLHTFLSRFTRSSSAIVAISSVAFGLIHWSLGLHTVLITSVIGAVFMIAYLSTRTLLPIMLAHFAVNFIDFAGVIPKSLFKLG